jgi:hypothetical protein
MGQKPRARSEPARTGRGPSPASLARARRRGDNAGMAGDDGRAQVQLDEDTLARRRRVLGEDHPDTLTSAFTVASELAELGEYQAAKELNEDILDRRRRILGDGHRDTVISASFALILSGLAADPKAREVMETVMAAWAQSVERRQPGS